MGRTSNLDDGLGCQTMRTKLSRGEKACGAVDKCTLSAMWRSSARGCGMKSVRGESFHTPALAMLHSRSASACMSCICICRDWALRGVASTQPEEALGECPLQA